MGVTLLAAIVGFILGYALLRAIRWILYGLCWILGVLIGVIRAFADGGRSENA